MEFYDKSFGLAKMMMQQALDGVRLKRLTVEIKVGVIEEIMVVEGKDRDRGRGSKILLYGNSTRSKDRIRQELEG